jgi:nitrite reductase/ring-hydroxylating ferredoxin subunit
MQDGSGGYRAFENKCAHAGRKLDPVPGTETVQCCSMGQLTYDYQGNVISGKDEKVKPLNVREEDGGLVIEL